MATMTTPSNLTTATLPITVVPGTNPPVFRWQQKVSTPVGQQWVEHEGSLPPTIESAVCALIGVAKQLLYDNAMLQGQVDGASRKPAVEPQPTKRGK